MSSFSYSHRVRDGNRLDSKRFRFGTTSQPEIFLEAARPILERKNLTEPLELLDTFGLDEMRFYGLGWDRSKRRFKVYIMIHNLFALPKRHREMLHRFYSTDKNVSNAVWQEADLLPHALLSFTYVVFFCFIFFVSHTYTHTGMMTTRPNCMRIKCMCILERWRKPCD